MPAVLLPSVRCFCLDKGFPFVCRYNVNRIFWNINSLTVDSLTLFAGAGGVPAVLLHAGGPAPLPGLGGRGHPALHRCVFRCIMRVVLRACDWWGRAGLSLGALTCLSDQLAHRTNLLTS